MGKQTHNKPSETQAATAKQPSSSQKTDILLLDREFFDKTEAAMKRIKGIRLKRPTLSQRIARALAGGN